MNYRETLQYLNSFLNFERVSGFSARREFSLNRMRIVLKYLGHPERQFKSILVAGTKGKGSTSCFLQSLLIEHGHKSGFYSSPHLSDFRERIRVNRREISQANLARTVSQLRRVLVRYQKPLEKFGPLTYFEAATCAAFLFFAQEKVRFAVLEVGMGGRLDATAVVHPILSIVTAISLDHEEHLGRTLRKIAGEKSRIIRFKTPCVLAPQTKDAELVLKQRARKCRAPIFSSGADYKTRNQRLSLKGSAFDFVMGARHLRQLQIQLPGDFQIENAANALCALYIMDTSGMISASCPRVRRGLQHAFWPGRFELIQKRGKLFLLDGAHNDASMARLFKNVERLFPSRRCVTILGVSREKRLPPMLQIASRYSSVVIPTSSTHERAKNVRTLLEEAQGTDVTLFPQETVQDAVIYAQKAAQLRDIIVITGSLFVVAEARKICKAHHEH